MKFIIKQIRELRAELASLREKNKELDEHIESLTHIYDMLIKQLKQNK